MKDIEESNKKTFISELAKFKAESYNIEIVNYDTFYDTYHKEIRKLQLLEMHLFALVNPELKPRIVFNNMYISLLNKFLW
jgi:hypothetical protein